MPANNPKRLAIGAAALLAMLSFPALAGGELRSFGNWIVGCDNKADCTVIGMTEAAIGVSKPMIALRIGVDSTSLSGFEVSFIPLEQGSPNGHPITITCLLCANGVRAPGGEVGDQVVLHGQRLALQGMQGAHWLDALGKGRRLAVAWAGRSASATIDTSAFLDAWKHLALTRGDLMRQVPLPALNGMSPKEQRKRAFPAREVIPSGYPGIMRLTRQCPAQAEVASYRQFVLPGNANLWGVICRKADTSTQHWFLSRGAADLPAELELPDGDRGSINAGRHGFDESVFDFDFGILHARSGPAGREDCGIRRAWAWDGGTWFLLERREMPACIGLEPSDWIRTYAAP